MRVPFRVPVTVGVKVTLIVQLELAANVAGQLLIWAKSPLVWMLPRFNAALPVLVRETAWAVLEVPNGWLGKNKVVGVKLAVVEPVPVRFTICGLPYASSLMVSVPLRVPEAVGVNVTLIAQPELGASVAGQVLVCA